MEAEWYPDPSWYQDPSWYEPSAERKEEQHYMCSLGQQDPPWEIPFPRRTFRPGPPPAVSQPWPG